MIADYAVYDDQLVSYNTRQMDKNFDFVKLITS